MNTSVNNNIVSFSTAQWLRELGFKDNNMVNGYATKSFEVCIPSGVKGTPSDYHDTEIGEFVEFDHISLSQNEKYVIAAPTVKEALGFITNFRVISVQHATTDLTKNFFRVVQAGAIILMESKPAEDFNEALNNLLDSKQFRAIVDKRLGVLH